MGARLDVGDVGPDGFGGEVPLPQAEATSRKQPNTVTVELIARTLYAAASELPTPSVRNRRAGKTLATLFSVPDSAHPLDATVLICTYNRAALLGETLDSLSRCQVNGLQWDVVVVDNNSSDDTRQVVASRIQGFPASLRYTFEPRQGKSIALNTGLATTDAAIIVFTDDDVRVAEDWLAASCRNLLHDPDIDYTGGPVMPIWEQPCPAWLDQNRPDLWGTLAILDYGQAPFIFEERRRVPLGANMAVRRSLIDRVGGFAPDLGRRGNSLLGQEQAEFFCRSRAAGARGLYVPAMAVHHHVPAKRLTRDYFRRWWFWKGVSKSRLEQRHPVTELGIDLSSVPRLLGVPRFMFGSALRDLGGWVRALVTRDGIERMRREMMLCYFAGYLKDARRLENETKRTFYSPATDKQ